MGPALATLIKILLFDVFPFLCRLIASILLLMALYAVGFPPTPDVNPMAISLFVLSIFFFLIPIAKKISLGKLLTFEKEVDKVKDEMSSFKAETRAFLSVYSNMITAISNTVSQTINVNLPGQAEAKEAKEDLDSSIEAPKEPSTLEDEVLKFINESGGDYNYALARLRMNLERSLRKALGKRTTTSNPINMEGKFLSARQLFKQFSVEYPKYENMHKPFDYVLKICNAAIHGQQVSEEYANEAIYMGIRMIEEINNLTE